MWDLLIFAGWQLWPALGRRKRDKSCNVCVERSSVKPFSLCSRWGSRDGVENEGGADESHGIRPRRYVFSMYTPVFFIFLSRPVVNVIQFFFPSSFGLHRCCYRCPTREFLPTLCVTDTPTFPIIFLDFSFIIVVGFIDGAIYTWCIRPTVTRQPVRRTHRGEKK